MKIKFLASAVIITCLFFNCSSPAAWRVCVGINISNNEDSDWDTIHITSLKQHGHLYANKLRLILIYANCLIGMKITHGHV